MDKVQLLRTLKQWTEDTTKDLLLPVRIQQTGEEKTCSAPAVYCMRLPDSRNAAKKAPYILHQLLTGKDVQTPGQEAESGATVRTIICVYCEDEQEGGMHLLEVAERIRIGLLRQVVLQPFMLDLSAGVEFLAYPDDTAPYFIGEMTTNWQLPAVQREVWHLWNE